MRITGGRKWLWALAALYLIAIHALLWVALLRPGVIDDQRWRAGWLQVHPDRTVRETHSMLRTIAAEQPPGRVLMVGDSQLQRLDTLTIARPAINFGIGGDEVGNSVRRLREYAARKHASGVVVWGGINDLLHGQTPQHVAQSVAIARSTVPADIPLFFIAIAPVSASFGGTRHSELASRITEANRLLAAACTGDCHFIDATAQLAGADGALLPAFDFGDGLHLNRAGLSVVADAINRNLAAQSGAIAP